jgi:hypothetical protein
MTQMTEIECSSETSGVTQEIARHHKKDHNLYLLSCQNNIFYLIRISCSFNARSDLGSLYEKLVTSAFLEVFNRYSRYRIVLKLTCVHLASILIVLTCKNRSKIITFKCNERDSPEWIDFLGVLHKF